MMLWGQRLPRLLPPLSASPGKVRGHSAILDAGLRAAGRGRRGC